MKHQISVFFILFLLSSNLFSQATGNITYLESSRWKFQNEQLIQHAGIFNMNELTMEVNGIFNATTSSYVAIFHIVQTAANARECDSLINKRIGNFKSMVMEAGIRDEDFITDMLSMVPLYEVEVVKRRFSKTYNEVPAGFEIQKNIHIRFENSQLLDRLVTAAAFEEIFDFVKVEYFVENVQAIYDTLRKTATALLKKREAQFESLGVKMKGQWRMVGEKQGVYYPMDRYTSYTSKSKPSLQSAKKEVSIQEIPTSSTLFYNKVPYSGYDFVVNPEMLEPQVQYTYSIQLKYEILPEPKETTPTAKKEIENKYFLVTPEGVIKEMPR